MIGLPIGFLTGFFRFLPVFLIVFWLVSYFYLKAKKNSSELIKLKMGILTIGFVMVLCSIFIFVLFWYRDGRQHNIAYLCIPFMILGFGILFRLKLARIITVWFSTLILSAVFILSILTILTDISGFLIVGVIFVGLFVGLPLGVIVFTLTRKEIKEQFK